MAGQSMTATRLRAFAAAMAPFWPAGPLPITTRSYSDAFLLSRTSIGGAYCPPQVGSAPCSSAFGLCTQPRPLRRRRRSPLLRSSARSLVYPSLRFHRPNINFRFRSPYSPLLNTIPVSCEKSDLLEFPFGPEPIVNLVAWEAATLKIDFICATPDFFVTWCGAC